MSTLTIAGILLAAIVRVIAPSDDVPADWTIYKKLDLGYIAGIPPGFHELGPTIGDTGMAFSLPEGAASLLVFSGELGAGGIAVEYARHRASFLDSGGTLNIEIADDGEASFMGSVDGRGVQTRIRSECEGTRHLTFILSYDASVRDEIAPLANEIESRLIQVFCPSPVTASVA